MTFLIGDSSVSSNAATTGYEDKMDQGALSNNVGIGTMLLRWKCSVYKVVYQEVIVFLVFFGVISAVYRNALTEAQQK